VRLLDVTTELPQIFFVEPDHIERELVELLAHRLFVEHAKHSIFTVNRRHDRNTEVDGSFGLAVLHAETAVLRYAALGNVELTHDLDTRNDGRVVLLRDGRHGLGEHAVNAELDGNSVVTRFNVNIGGAALKRGEDCRIHETDNRADIALRRQSIDRD